VRRRIADVRRTGWKFLTGLAALLLAVATGTCPPQAAATEVDAAQLAETVRAVRGAVLSEDMRAQAAGAINRELRRRLEAANAQSRSEWGAITTRAEWEAYRDERIARLRGSLGEFPEPPRPLNVKITGIGTVGEGYRVLNVVYESRPGQWVTGNLYEPPRPLKSMPTILIAHAHHRPKEQGELQDMGMTWARAGCVVLVIDQVGYGERRSHPFHTAADYAREYPVSRQDYFFRYDTGIQLQLAGDSLMGWMACDLMRGIDLLLARPHVDPQRVILLGAVAGGGDPCGVTAALDPRIAAAVPFNFGGPQPETRYPLPEDAETSFNYLGGSYWESTRGLRRGGIDGFPHWVIVGSIAPRRLIHAHEFVWDQDRDPVWRRYQKIYGEFYGVPEHLAFTHGKGLLRQSGAEASHCTNIGAYHRRLIHPAFQKWFGIEVTPESEFSQRLDPEQLRCLTDIARASLRPRNFVELVGGVADERLQQAREALAALPLQERRTRLRTAWAKLLGDVTPAEPRVVSSVADDKPAAPGPGIAVQRVVLEVEPDVQLPVLVLAPEKRAARAPAVVVVAQTGKEALLRERSEEIGQYLARGMLVCLPDVRGTGEIRAGTSRDRTSDDGNRSVNLLLYGETMLGQRLRDVRSLLAWLRSRDDVDGQQIELWGDSLAAVNPADTDFQVPYGVSGRPEQSEPLGGLLAVLGALFDEDIREVRVRGGLLSYRAVLDAPSVLIPHDVVVPGALTAGDVSDLVAALAPRPVRLEQLVDGLNRAATAGQVRSEYARAVEAYRAVQATERLKLDE